VISNLFYPVELFVDGSKGLSPTIWLCDVVNVFLKLFKKTRNEYSKKDESKHIKNTDVEDSIVSIVDFK
jgi:hypothetical protein